MKPIPSAFSSAARHASRKPFRGRPAFGAPGRGPRPLRGSWPRWNGMPGAADFSADFPVGFRLGMVSIWGRQRAPYNPSAAPTSPFLLPRAVELALGAAPEQSVRRCPARCSSHLAPPSPCRCGARRNGRRTTLESIQLPKGAARNARHPGAEWGQARFGGTSYPSSFAEPA